MTLCESEIAKQVMKYGKTIYHYTSLKALCGILENREMWACSSSTANDKKEAIFFVEELSERLKQDLSGDAQKRCIAFFDSLERRLETEMPYIICFSQEADDASQWDRYADLAKGVCISFDTANLLKSWNFITTNSLNPIKVLYGCAVEKHDHYKNLKSYFETDIIPDGYLRDEKGMQDNILACSYGIKHPSFRAEHEVRYTTFWNRNIQNAKHEYVLKGGQIVGIWKVPLIIPDKSLDVGIDIEDIIQEVTIGPRSTQSIDNLKCYFENRLGLQKLAQHIRVSECPLR